MIEKTAGAVPTPSILLEERCSELCGSGRRWNNLNKLFGASTETAIIVLVLTPSAPGVEQKELIPPCKMLNRKCSTHDIFLSAKSAKDTFNTGQSPHRFRLPFSLLLSFGQAKERRENKMCARETQC
jgi:hypothetical protein